MSDSDPDSAGAADKLSSLRSWPLYVGIACLAIAVWPFVVQGLSSWRDDDALRTVTTQFFHDVAAGRQDTALACLSKDYRQTVTAGWLADKPTWTKTDDLTIQILSVQQRGDTAEVRVSLAKSGFSVKPTILLRRFKDRNWRITEIDGVDTDPRWLRREEREAEESGESIADELAEKLHLPPVTDSNPQ